MEYVTEDVKSDRRKIATWGAGSVATVMGRIVRHLGWEQVPLTGIPSGSSSDFLGTKRPQLGSWIRRICASVVSNKEISASGCLFMLAESMRRLSRIITRPLVSTWMPSQRLLRALGGGLSPLWIDPQRRADRYPN